MRRFQDQRAQLIGLMQHFMRDLSVGENHEQLLFVLSEIHATATELFRYEDETLRDATDNNKYRERHRANAHTAKHFEILTDIDHAIRYATDLAHKSSDQHQEARSCVAHALDSLIMHLVLERRALTHDVAV